MIERIDRHIARSQVIKIYTDVEGDESVYLGIPVRRSRSLLALHGLSNFHFDGYQVIRLRDIERIRMGGFETVTRRILRSTGELKNHVNPDWLRIGSWKSLLSCLKARSFCVGVESGLININWFLLGEIHALKDKAVTMKSFDAQARWHKPKLKMKYTDITEATFGDEYAVTFNEYMKTIKPKWVTWPTA